VFQQNHFLQLAITLMESLVGNGGTIFTNRFYRKR